MEHDPKYSVGMMIETVVRGNSGHGNYTNIVTKRGVIVGWTRVPSNNPLPNPTVYHVLIKPDYFSRAKDQNPIIKTIREGRYGMINLNIIEY